MLNGIKIQCLVDFGCNLTIMLRSLISMLNMKLLKAPHIRVTIMSGSKYELVDLEIGVQGCPAESKGVC